MVRPCGVDEGGTQSQFKAIVNLHVGLMGDNGTREPLRTMFHCRMLQLPLPLACCLKKDKEQGNKSPSSKYCCFLWILGVRLWFLGGCTGRLWSQLLAASAVPQLKPHGAKSSKGS